MNTTTRKMLAGVVLCVFAWTPAWGSVSYQVDVPELTGTFVHGQAPISFTVDFGVDFEYMPDLFIDVTGTGTPGESSSTGAFPADLVVTVNHPYIDPAEVIAPTVLGPYGVAVMSYGADNTSGDVLLGDLHTDSLNDLVGVFPAQFQIVISSNPEHADVTTPSTVDIQNVTLVMLPCEQQDCFGGDGFVGIADLNVVLSYWNQNVIPGDCLSGDHDGDGYVGIADLNVVLGNWNSGTPPAVVPEPAVMACAGLGLLWLVRRAGI